MRACSKNDKYHLKAPLSEELEQYLIDHAASEPNIISVQTTPIVTNNIKSSSSSTIPV